MKRLELPPHKTATFVLPKWKLVYVSVPKAACTSLKWLMADLQGESHEHFYEILGRETARSLTVHRRSRWPETPMLHELSDEQLEEISAEDGWYVFGVVRHPAARLWSAWQSKVLLKDPRFVALYPEAPWPRVPTTTADVIDDFQAFTRTLDDAPKQRIFGDRHFLAQTRLLSVDRTPYSKIYRTSELPQLLDDLEKHLRPQGLDTMPELPTSNETPLRPLGKALTPEMTEIIGKHYASDYERFGYADPVPEGLERRDAYSTAQLGEIGRLVDRSERIGDLHDIAARWRQKQRETARELNELRQKQRETARELNELRQQVQKLRRAEESGPRQAPAESRLRRWVKRAHP